MQSIFLQGAPEWTNMVFFGIIILIFWLFLIRPQAKKAKKQKNFMEELEKGDEVVTASGIIGRINKLEDDIVTLEVGSKVFIRMTKTAISQEMTESLFSPEEEKK